MFNLTPAGEMLGRTAFFYSSTSFKPVLRMVCREMFVIGRVLTLFFSKLVASLKFLFVVFYIPAMEGKFDFSVLL